MITKAEIDELVREHFHELLEQDEHRRVLDKADYDWRKDADVAHFFSLANEPEEVDAAIEDSGKHPADFTLDKLIKVTHDCMKIALQRNDWKEAELFIDEIMGKKGLKIPKDSLEYRLLCQGIVRATFEATGIILERSAGNWGVEPNEPLFRLPRNLPNRLPNPSTADGRTTTAPRPAESLTVLVERFLTEKRGISEKSMLDYRAAIRALEEFLGNGKPIGSIEKADIVAFKDILLLAPSNYTKRFPGATLPQAIEQNKSAKAPTLLAGTINNKYLSSLSTFFRWAEANDLIGKNPAQGVRVHLSKKELRQRRRLPFTIDQLNRIFSAPLYTGCRSATNVYEAGDHLVRDHRFWAPLIALWTGARANEIGQLGVNDLAEVEGVWCFSFTDAGDEEKSLKTEAARRLVPVHPELLRIGLVDYRERILAGGHTRLFPAWQRGKDGYYSSVFSKWFARFLGSLDLNDKRLVFHSFRHGMKDAMRRAGIEGRIQDALIGHESGHVSETYGMGYGPKELAKSIELVRYEGLNLSKLRSGP